MANLGTLTLDIVAKIGGFTGPMSQAERQASKSSKNIQSSFKSMATAIGASIATATAALSYYVQKSNHAADESIKAAQKAGISVESFTGLAFVADLAGVNMEGFTGAMVKLNKALGEASVGSAEQLASFRALGISVKDSEGNIRTADKVLVDLADKFSKMPDGVDKTAMAMKVFGKSGAEMIPFLNGGSAAIKELITLAQDLGVVIGEEQAKKAEQFNDSLTVLSYAAKGAANRLAGELLPALNDLVGVAIDYSKQANKAAGATSGLQDSFRGVTAFAIQAATAVANVYRAVYTLGEMGSLLAQGKFGEALKAYKDVTATNKAATAEAQLMASRVLSGQSAKSGEDAASKIGKMKSVLQAQSDISKTLANADEKRRQAIIAKAKAEEEALVKEYEWQKRLIELKISANEITDIEGTKQKIALDEKILEAQRKSLEVQVKQAKEEKDKISLTASYWETYEKGSRQAIEARYMLNEKLDDQNEKEVALSKELMQIMNQTSAYSGFKSALSSYYENAKNIGTSIEQLTTRAFQNMEDAIIKFAQTGKLSFTDMANSIIADMMRIAIQQTITAPLANMMFSYFSPTSAGTTSGMGGWSSASSTTLGGNLSLTGTRASGGSVNAHGTYLVGEQGPELLSMGNNSGFITPNVSVGGSQEPSVIINIENNTGSQMGVTQNTSFDGKQFVVNAVVENIQSNGVLRSMIGAR